MEQVPTRIDKRPPVQEYKIKKIDELALTSDTLSPQIFGIDRNLLIGLTLIGVSMGFSLYLFKEVKKIRDDVMFIKSQEPDSELIDKVEENSEAVKAIELKLDQLITALESRERRYSQPQPVQSHSPVQSQPQPPPVQSQTQPPQNVQTPQINEQEYQQYLSKMTPPVMGGSIAGQTVISDPGIIRI